MQETNLKFEQGVFFVGKRMEFGHRFSMILLLLQVMACGIMLSFSTVIAADKPQVPIHIEADRMISQEQDRAVIFQGNVDAKQGEVLIRTDEMTVYYSQSQGSKGVQGASEVDKLICKGNVQISQGDWLGTGGRMDYYAGERKVVLSKDAKAWQGQNMVAGKTITYFLDDGRSIVEGPATADSKSKKGSGRVKAIITPDAKGK